MSTRDDDSEGMDGVDEVRSDMSGRGTDRATHDAALTQFLSELRSLGRGPVPPPSPELVAMLGGATPLPAQRIARHRHTLRWSLAAAVAAIVLLSSLAAKHTLPEPAQRLVSSVVNNLTPFHIDANDHGGAPVHRSPSLPVRHSATSPVAPAPRPSSPVERPAPQRTASGTDDGGGEVRHQSSSPSSDGGTSAPRRGGDDGGSSSSGSGSGGGPDGGEDGKHSSDG